MASTGEGVDESKHERPHAAEMAKSISKKQSAASIAESESIRKRDQLKKNQEQSRNAKDSGKREKGYQ